MEETRPAEEKLHELESSGLAKFHKRDDSENGALPVLRLAKRVKDLREVIKDSKVG